MKKLEPFFAGMGIAAGIILIFCLLALLFTRCQPVKQFSNHTVAISPKIEPPMILKGPSVQVSELPKVEPELPQEFLPNGQQTNVIQSHDELLEWLKQLEQAR